MCKVMGLGDSPDWQGSFWWWGVVGVCEGRGKCPRLVVEADERDNLLVWVDVIMIFFLLM